MFGNTQCQRKDFIEKRLSFKKHIIDIGCGNGKYSNYRKDIEWHGMDTCIELLNCFESDKVLLANGLNIPYKLC